MLTVNDLVDVAYSWSTAFAYADECEHLLLSNGCKAFLVYQDYVGQFAERPEDIDLHKLFYRERCRQAAVCAPVICYHPLETRLRYYRSEIIDAERLALAVRAGFSDFETWMELAKPEPIEIEPDPILRVMAMKLRKIGGGRQVFDHHMDIFKTQARLALEAEAERFPQGQTGSFVSGNRLRAFHEASSSHLSHLGFRAVSTRLKDYVAFDYDVSDDLVIRWSIGDEHSFLLGNLPASCQPALYLRQRTFLKRAKDGSEKARFLKIPFASVVEGVSESYYKCSDLKEMNAIVYAQSLIVSWLLPYLVQAVR